MSPRKVLLIVLLIALGLSAASGVFIISSASGREIEAVLGVSITTAVTAGLMLPLTLLLERPRLRWCGIVSLVVFALAWLCVVGLFVSEFSRSPLLEQWCAFGLGFLALMGIPAALMSLLASFRWARIAAPAFVAVAALSWLVAMVSGAFGIFIDFAQSHSSYYSRHAEMGFASGAALYGLGVCICGLLINARNGDSRHFRYPGIATSMLAAVVAVFVLWVEPRGWVEDLFMQTLIFLVVTSVVLMLINLLLMARLRGSQTWLRTGTIALAVGSALAFVIAALAVHERRLSEAFARLGAAGTLATFCASLALIVFSLFNRKPPEQMAPGALTATEISLVCPRCSCQQLLPFGGARCKQCDLSIAVQVHEPRCAGCGYLLYNLTSPNCPECGAAIGSVGAVPPVVAAAV